MGNFPILNTTVIKYTDDREKEQKLKSKNYIIFENKLNGTSSK